MKEKTYICPKCGNKVKSIYEGLCNMCNSETADIFEINTKEIKICKICNNLHEGLKIIKIKSNNQISEIIKNRIKPNKKLKKFNCSINPIFEKENEINAEINIKAKSEGNIEINENYSIPFKIKHITCEKCSKHNTEYFEAVLQIRNKNENTIEEVMNNLFLILEEEKKRSVFATNILNVKNGVDVYITSQKHIKTIGKKLFEIYGGEMKINEKLFTRDHLTSKDLYRVNVLLSIPNFKKESIIEYEGKLIHITSIRGHFFSGKDLINNKNVKIKYDTQKIKLIQEKPIETIIVKSRPNYEILNPNNYQNETVMNPEKITNNNNNNNVRDNNIKEKNKVRIVIYNGSIWVI